MPSLISDTAAVVTSTTMTLTPAISGSQPLLLVGWAGNSFYPPTKAEYNGVAMTVQETVDGSSNVGMRLYYVINPAVGGSVLFEMDLSAGTRAAWAGTIDDVDQASPFSASTTSAQSSTNFTYSIASAVGEKVFDICMEYNQNSIATVNGFTATQSGQTQCPSTAGGGTTNAASIQASFKTGATSVTLGWLDAGATIDGSICAAVSIKPAVVARSRAIKYFHDINDPGGRIYDDLGRVVPPWELEPNNWIRVTGVFLPTSTKYASFTQDPELAYIEEVTYSIRGGLRIKTNRGEMAEVLLARAAGGKTL